MWMGRLALLAMMIICCCHSQLANDPLEQLIRSGSYLIRDFVHRVLSRVSIPRLTDFSSPSIVAFQSDDRVDAQCGPCDRLQADWLVDRWRLVAVSSNFLINTISELSETIDILASHQPFNQRRSFASLLQSPPDISCLFMTGLLICTPGTRCSVAAISSTAPLPVEVVYLDGSKQRSIIGQMILSTMDETITFRLAPNLVLNLCARQLNMANRGEYLLVAEKDDRDGMCINYLLLTRNGTMDNRQLFNNNNLINELRRSGADSAMNPLRNVFCDSE